MKYIFHIGTNEGLAIAEIGSVLGYECIEGVYKNYMLVNTEIGIDQTFLNGLGSVISIYRVSEVMNGSVDDLGLQLVNEYFDQKDFESKINFAISSNCLLANDIQQLLKNVKKNLKSISVSCRFIENVTAAAFKEAGEFGKEMFALGLFKFSAQSSEIFLAEMICIQDIDAYSARDYSKPYRSAKLGMLPPKLTQIMLNLTHINDLRSGVPAEKVVYDPFCGTGTVLLEALLMNHKVKGSDIQEVNITGTLENLEWIEAKNKISSDKVVKVFELDATKINRESLDGVDCIVTEGFLGKVKQGDEHTKDLLSELDSLSTLYYDFLSAVSKASPKAGFCVVLTLPVYRGNGEDSKKNFFIENLVEKLEKLRYSVEALVPENNFGQKYKESILYKRSDQKVYRQVYRFTLSK